MSNYLEANLSENIWLDDNERTEDIDYVNYMLKYFYNSSISPTLIDPELKSALDSAYSAQEITIEQWKDEFNMQFPDFFDSARNALDDITFYDIPFDNMQFDDITFEDIEITTLLDIIINIKTNNLNVYYNSSKLNKHLDKLKNENALKGGKLHKDIIKNKIIYFNNYNIRNKKHLILNKKNEARGRIIDDKIINNLVKVKHNNIIFNVPINNIRFLNIKSTNKYNVNKLKKNKIIYFRDTYIRNKDSLILNKNKEARGRIINDKNIKTHVKVKHNNTIFNVPINNIRLLKINNI